MSFFLKNLRKTISSTVMTTYQTVCPSLVASLELLTHHRNVASLSLFYSYYFGRCSSKLPELVSLLHSCGRSTCYSNRLHSFFVTFPRFYKDFYVNGFFPPTARIWNSLPAECFSLTSDINDFKSWVNRHLFPLSSFYTIFLYDFHLYFLATPSLVVPAQPCMEWNWIEKS